MLRKNLAFGQKISKLQSAPRPLFNLGRTRLLAVPKAKFTGFSPGVIVVVSYSFVPLASDLEGK
jgi:hypothetical protein